MRAAAESSATAKRAREAVARSVRPQLQPSVVREDGKLLGKVQCGEGRSAIDVTVAWMLANDETITDQVARLEPSRADRPADTANSLVVDLNLPDATNEWEGIKMVWIEYWDASRVGHWQDTWLLGTEPHDQGRLQQTESRLVD